MEYNVKNLIGFTMGATDGEFGKVEDFYFDDETWTIRYLVVRTGGWLSGRKVLISPAALSGTDTAHKSFPVNLSKEQIRHSPDIDTEKIVSREQEIELYRHYAWPFEIDSGAGFYGGMGMMGMTNSRLPLEDAIFLSKEDHESGATHSHLRSTSEIKAYSIHATDGAIGEAEDFIIDKDGWAIKYLVIDTGNWLPGKEVVISPEWISKIEWAYSSVYVNLSKEAVKNSTGYDSSLPLQEESY